LARQSSQWSVTLNIPSPLGSERFYTAISEMLVTEADDNSTVPTVRAKLRLTSNLCSGFEEDDDLRRILLYRSETDFLSRIQASDRKTLLSSLHDQRCMSVLASWPEGIRLLGSTLDLHHPNAYPFLNELWKNAVGALCEESMHVLLDCGAQVSLSDWYNVDCRPRQIWSTDKEHKLWHEVLLGMALRLRSFTLETSRPDMYAELGFAADLETRTVSLYHWADLSILAADAAWMAGHHDLNIQQNGRYRYWSEEDLLTTPLWLAANDAPQNWPYCVWLLDHGADPT
jgi:hypothetical protein